MIGTTSSPLVKAGKARLNVVRCSQLFSFTPRGGRELIDFIIKKKFKNHWSYFFVLLVVALLFNIFHSLNFIITTKTTKKKKSQWPMMKI